MKLPALLATLALSPVLLHAQPATHAPVLEAALNGAPSLAAAAPTPSTGNATALRVSTGVVPPHLIHSVDVTSEMDWEWAASDGKERTAEVSLVVDATGKPTHVQIVKSAGIDLDQNVLEAVNQYRFTPATVSNQTAPMNVDLTLKIRKPAYWTNPW